MLTIRNWVVGRKNSGIGLLELMLSLAIIAILLIMATRFYTTASRSQKINENITLIGNIKQAAQDYYSGSGSSVTGFGTNAYKYVASSYVSGATVIDSWGKPITITPDDTAKTIDLKFTAPSQAAFDLMSLRLTGGGAVSGSYPDLHLKFNVAGGT